MAGTRSRIARLLLLAVCAITLSGGCRACRDYCDDDRHDDYYDDHYEHEVDHHPADRRD